jgi:hypothetical protein
LQSYSAELKPITGTSRIHLSNVLHLPELAAVGMLGFANQGHCGNDLRHGITQIGQHHQSVPRSSRGVQAPGDHDPLDACPANQPDKTFLITDAEQQAGLKLEI